MLDIIQNQIGVDKNRLGGKASRIWEDAVENMQESGEKEELGVFWDICQYWIPAGDEILILASSRIFRFFSDLICRLDIWGNSGKWNQQTCNLDSQIVTKISEQQNIEEKNVDLLRGCKNNIIFYKENG